MPNAVFINLCEFLLQKAVEHEAKGKSLMVRSAQMWARGSYGISEHFRKNADYDFARAEELFMKAAGYEATRKFLASPDAAALNIAVGTLPTTVEAAVPVDYAVC